MPFVITKSVLAAVAAIASHSQTSPLPDKPVAQQDEPPTTSTPAPSNPNTFNPQLSLILDFRSPLFDSDHSQPRKSLLNEAEIGLAADIDPFLRGYAFLSFHKENGNDVASAEEAYAQYTNLGHGFTAKFGRIAAAIGRVGRNHVDQLNFLDYPMVVQDFLGDDGLRSGGGSVSYLLPGDHFHEFTLEALTPDDGNLFVGSNTSKPVIVSHYRTFVDFNEDLSTQLGATFASGPGAGNRQSTLYGADLAMKWQPGSKGRSAVVESEAFWGKPGSPGASTAFGAFVSVTYQLNPTLFGNIKFDSSDVPGSTDHRQGWSVGLTLKPTEFEHWRVEYQTVTSNFSARRSTINVQFQVAMGAHPAHKY